MLKLKNKIFLFLSMILAVASLVAVSAFAQTNDPVVQNQLRSHINLHKPMSDVENPKVMKMLNDSWNLGKNKISNQQPELNLNNWEIVDSGDIDISFTNQLTYEEASSFNAALFSDERKHNLEYGDKFPALLLNPAKNHAMLFWEKYNGNYFFINIESTPQKDGTLRWHVAGTAEVPK
ncbi:hypothetical protein [Ferviditalea candida]|uniref:DUF4767 domain-containing protein n=1 Tax=Ferviditalea candida TaxID=3108399 RepID=A0ABU5ZI12_9BACL|nr:hypothetical protein [Paenibacillaceae bacterium T2]